MAGVAIAKAIPNKANIKDGPPTNGMARPNITDPISPVIMTAFGAL